MNLLSPIAKFKFKINMGWEGKEELKPRISAICKISFEPFSKSHSRKRTRKHSANKGLPIFWGWVFFPLQEYGKCQVLYPYLLIFSIFTDHLHRKIVFLSQVSHEETNASCSQNQKAIQPVIIHGNHCSPILSGETSKTEKDKVLQQNVYQTSLNSYLGIPRPTEQILSVVPQPSPVSVRISQQWANALGNAHVQSGPPSFRTRNRRKHLSYTTLEIVT